MTENYILNCRDSRMQPGVRLSGAITKPVDLN
jgi:hypothetical protein